MCGRFVGFVLFMSFALNGAAAADIIVFDDFSDISSLMLNGVAASMGNPIDDGTKKILRLTNDFGQGGSVFSKNSIALTAEASFSTAFSFRMVNPMGGIDIDGPGADGIVFVVQTEANNVGVQGGGIGYAGILKSVGIEFDSWMNLPGDAVATNDTDGNHVAIDLNGSLVSTTMASLSVSTIGRLNDGGVWYAWVDYSGSTDLIEVRISRDGDRPTTPILTLSTNLSSVLQRTSAFVGFTAATGAASNQHEILSWTFVNEYAPLAVRFVRGDANASNAIDIADAIFVLTHLFAQGPAPSCKDTGDANDDGNLDIADAIKMLAHLFAAAGPLPQPFGACGIDPTDDALDCASFAPCQ